MSTQENSSQKTPQPTLTAKVDVGGKYEISVAVLVAATLSINEEVENYCVFTNLKEAHPFDDVVAVVFFKGESAPYAYAIQLKHVGKGETLKVEKYLNGYTIIVKNGGFKTIGNIAVDNIQFCYFCIKGVRVSDYTLETHNPTAESWRSALSFQNCHILSYNKPMDKDNEGFFENFYLYLYQPDTNKIKESIKSNCNIKDVNDILKYVDRFFERGELWKRGLSKEVFETELLKIRLSDYILPPTDITQLNNSQSAIWNKLSLQDNVIIVKAEDNIEKSLYGCIAQMLNHLLDNVDWNKCKKNTLDDSVITEFRKLFPARVRHWIDPPTTLKSLIIELWKCRELPLILNGEDQLPILEDYAHLNKSYIIVTDKSVSRCKGSYTGRLRIVTHVRDIKCLEIRDELLNTISISLQGRKPITLSSIVKHHKELTATLSCSHILHLMKSRKAYLSKECLKGDHNMVFLIEDPTSSAEYSIDRLNKVGRNIAIWCRPDEVRKYREQIDKNPKLRNYTVYRCATSSENENFTLIEGNISLLGNFFVDQDGESVLENSLVPIIGASLKNIEDSYIPRFLRPAVISETLFDSPIKGICFFSGDLSHLDVNMRNSIVEISPDMFNRNMQSQKENIFVQITSEDVNRYWEQASNLKCPLLHIRVEGTDMELCKCKNWKGLSDYITYSGRRISEETFLAEITDGITVLTGEPGMGKSSLLRSLFKNHAKDKYVLFYNLVDFRRYLEQNNLVDGKISIDFIFNQIKPSKYIEILSSLYESKQNVLVLLDAFDEVLPVYEKDVLDFVRNLSKSNVQVIVATRSIADYLLIDTFGTRNFKVDILGEDDRNAYIKRCKLDEQELNRVPREFLENPLYLNFLKVIIFDRHISLTNINKITLYDAILDIKLDDYFEGNFEKIHEFDKKSLLEPVLELHSQLSLVTTLGKNVASKILGEDKIGRKLSNQLKVGIIEFIDEDGYPTFVHQTFAEYLTANYLIRNSRNQIGKDIYREMMNSGDLALLNILYEDLELHKAVIRQNIQDVRVFAKKASNLSAVDKLGRTALHAAAICYQRTVRSYNEMDTDDDDVFYDGRTDLSAYNKSFEIINIIVQQMRKNQCDFLQSSLLIRWDWQYHIPPDTGLAKSILEVYINTVKQKLEKGYKVPTTFWFEKFNDIFLTAVKARSASIIRDLLYIKNYGSNSNFDRLYRGCLNSDYKILETVTSNINVTNGLTPLHVACIYGNVKVAERFVNLTNDVNAIDEFNYTPLYYSIINTHEVSMGITKLLLEAGANPNYVIRTEETPLSIAVRMGNLYVAGLLLEHGAYANNINENFEAPLLIAVNEGNRDMVELLLEYPACLNGNYGTTALTNAAAKGRTDIVSLLLDKGVEVNDQGLSGSSALLAAVHKPENLPTVNCLLAYGAYVDSISSIDGETPLFIAVRKGNKDIVRSLLEFCANPNATNTYCETPIFKSDDLAIAKLLLEHGANVNSREMNHETPIFDASSRDCVEKVKLLLEYRANVNYTTTDGRTPLFAAAAENHLNTVQVLLGNEALVNLANENGESPLFIASALGHSHVMERLLEYGGDVSQTNTSGETPLSIASTRDDLDPIRLLLTYGANINHTTPDGKTPIFIASARNRLDIVELLLENGADVNSATNAGDTPIFIASKRGCLDMVELLLQNGADSNDIIGNGELLCIAAKKKSLVIVNLMLEKGVKVNKARWFGMSALSHAIKSDCLDLVRLLIDAGANVNRVDKYELTPLSHAAEGNNPVIVELLLRRGANVNAGWPLYFAAANKDLTIAKLLLANDSINVNNKEQAHGESPLFMAVRVWNLNMVKLLLEHNIDVNIASRGGNTALFNILSECPCGRNELRFDLVKLLLDHNANVGEKYLDAAVKIGYRPIVKLISKKM